MSTSHVVLHDLADVQRVGGIQVARGIWLDVAGFLHWNLPELLALAGLEDTPAHRAMVCAMATESLRARFQLVVLPQTLTVKAS
jgi:hypothetical protein